VEILGGRKREIKVELDLKKLKEREISALQVSDALSKSGMNIPVDGVVI
jgi:multidrug efflux pump subunit AcrB